MATSTLSVPTSSTQAQEYETQLLDEDLEAFVDDRTCQTRFGRGALTGVLLGAGMWAVILTATGVIKL
jgi:hypothetical protein